MGAGARPYDSNAAYCARVHLTANEWALILVLGGALMGGVAAIAGGMLQTRLQSKNAAMQQKAQHEHAIDQQKTQHEQATAQQKAQHEHETMLAFGAARRDGYLEALTWFALVRDGLRDSLRSAKRWDDTEYITDRRGTAYVDALTEMYGTAAFREATSKWQPAFQDLLDAHDDWMDLSDAVPQDKRPGHKQLNAAHSHLQDRMANLTTVLLSIQEVARREAGELRLQP